jgi:hypothetical protein
MAVNLGLPEGKQDAAQDKAEGNAKAQDGREFVPI